MTKVIVWKRADGGISITHPTAEAEGMTIDQIARHAQQQDPDLADSTYDIIDKTDLPTDRYFRNAWSKLGKKIDVDIPRAREIHLNNLKAIRNEKLNTLDVETMKNITKPNQLQQIEVKKQLLRDMPDIIAEELKSITDLEALKNYKPNMLKE